MLLLPNEPHRSPLAEGIAQANRIITIAVEFVVLPVAGWWLDGRFGTAPFGVMIGLVLGLVVGTLHLMRLSRRGGPTPS